jgi:hypothetical protein
MQKARIRLIAISVGVLLLLVIIHTYLPPACANQRPQQIATPEQVVRQFYRWYLNAGYPEPGKQKSRFRRYVTQGCLKKAIAAEDYVYFTQAQDGDPGWKNHIAVASAQIRGGKATTSVILTGNDFSDKLRIDLVQEKGVWKIDNVDSEE